jgi:flavodoxin
MKKLILSIVAICIFAANANAKSLVVYFSMPETDTAQNMTTEEENSTVVIDGKVFGNTQYVAQIIAENTSSDIFRITPKTEYTTNHKELVDLASKELSENARPEIANSIANFDDYDTFFIGYPIWWADMPMIMYSFFDEYDFVGKKIIPFSTHGGSGLAGTVQKIIDIEPNADVEQNAFTTSRDSVAESKDEIIKWLDSLDSSQINKN